MKTAISNVTFKDFIHAHIAYAIYLDGAFFRYRKTYRNYLKVLSNTFRKKYPFQAKLRTGATVILPDRMATYFLTLLKGNEDLNYDLEHDTVTLGFENDFQSDPVNVMFEGAIRNGDILATFLEHEYDNIPVQDNTIVDIGANIGDTAIYFALKGASRIIAVEPYLANYKLAERNIKTNGFANRVELILGGCSGKTGELLVDPNFRSSIVSSLAPARAGIKVPLMTLEKLAEIAGDKSELVLKMDCEGCEYDSIISTSDHVLRKFRYIQIEYHHGYLDLKSKLERCGFKVRTSRPMANYRRQLMGYVHAERS